MTENELIRSVTEEYLSGIDVDIRPAPGDVERELLQATNNAIEAYNLGPRDPNVPPGGKLKDMYPDQKKGEARLRLRKHLDPFQIALVVRELHHAVGVLWKDAGDDGNFDIGIYQTSGDNEGTYDVSEDGLTRLIRSYDSAITIRGVYETIAVLRTICEVKARTADRDLVVVNNGVYDYGNKMLLGFDPDFVFTSKVRVDFVENAPNPVIHNDADGTDWDAYYCPHTSKARGATCTFSRQYPQEYVDAEVIEMVKLASRSDAFVEALRRRINDETDVEQLREDAERIGREQAANDKRMRMLMNQIDALDPADRSYERKFSDLQRRLDDLYDRDAGFQEALEETQAKIAAADKRRVGERKLLDELDRIPELLEEADEQTRFDIVHEAVSEVRILADRNPRKERVVQSVTFKCPVRFFWEEVPGVADGYTAVTPDSFDADGNFRDDETHVETVVLLSQPKPEAASVTASER